MKDDETRDIIIKAAEELFKQKDYEDISIKEICRLANTSIGSFYRHVGSKEKLFKIFHLNLGAKAMGRILECTNNKAPMEKITVIINIYLDFILHYDYKFVKYFLSLSLENEIFANPPGALDAFLKDYIDEASENGEFNPKYNADYVYRAVFSSLRGATFDWCMNMGVSDLRGEYNATLNTLLDGFAKK